MLHKALAHPGEVIARCISLYGPLVFWLCLESWHFFVAMLLDVSWLSIYHNNVCAINTSNPRIPLNSYTIFGWSNGYDSPLGLQQYVIYVLVNVYLGPALYLERPMLECLHVKLMTWWCCLSSISLWEIRKAIPYEILNRIILNVLPN